MKINRIIPEDSQFTLRIRSLLRDYLLLRLSLKNCITMEKCQSQMNVLRR